MREKTIKILLAAIAIILIITVPLGLALLTPAQHQVNTSGTITSVGIGVYSDQACTQNLTSIQWGNVSLGETKQYTAFVKNEGRNSVTLSMSVSNWNPIEAVSYIHTTWDSGNQVIIPNQVKTIVISLLVDSNIPNNITSFTSVMTIIGSG